MKIAGRVNFIPVRKHNL